MKDTLKIEPGKTLPKGYWSKFEYPGSWVNQAQGIQTNVQISGSDRFSWFTYLSGVSFRRWPIFFPFMPALEIRSAGFVFRSIGISRVEIMGFEYVSGLLYTFDLGPALYGDMLKLTLEWKDGFAHYVMHNKDAKKLFERKSPNKLESTDVKWIIRPHKAAKSNELVTLDYYSSI